MRYLGVIKLTTIMALVLLAGPAQAQQGIPKPHSQAEAFDPARRAGVVPSAEGSFAFVGDVIYDLATMEDMRARMEKDIAESKAAGRPLWADCIRNNTRAEIDIRARIARLGGPHDLQHHVAELPEVISKLYTAKLETITEMTRLCSVMAEGLRPDADYGKMASYMPVLTGRAYEIDHALFQSTVLIFGALLDMDRPRHLIITSKQRDSMVKSITVMFGEDKLSQTKDQNYLVAAGAMLREALKKAKPVDED